MNQMLKQMVVPLILLLLCTVVLMAAENGENKFVKTFGMAAPHPGRTAWDIVVLPDLNDNGVNEVLVACDNDNPAVNNGNGCDYYVLERQDNDSHKVLWHSFVDNVVEEYSATYGDTDNDGNIEIIACMRPGVVGAPSLVFWEVDRSLPGYPLPDMPTLGYDLSLGQGWARAFTAKVADVDKDGKNELMVGMRPYSATGVGAKNVGLILQEHGGDLAFPDFREEFRVTGYNGSAYGLQTGDADNDGLTDIYFGEYDYSGLFVVENTAPDSYKVHQHLNFTPGTDQVSRHDMGIYDFNGDGFTELVYATNVSGEVLIITNPGEIALMDSTCAHVIAQLPYSIYGIAVADQDWTGSGNDGRDIYCAADSGLYDIEYTGGEGGDVTDPANWAVHQIASGDYFFAVGAGDFDRDGRREIVVCSASDESPEFVQYFEHEPLPNFGVKVVWNDPSQKDNPADAIKGNPRGFTAGSDIDKDGKKELIATQYSGRLVMYEVVGDNSLELVWVDSTAKKVCAAASGGSNPRSVTVADVDRNGKQEIIAFMGSTAAHADSLGVWFFEWNGQDNGFGAVGGGPTFILPLNQINPALTDGNRTETIAAADVDNDGMVEMLLANDGTPNTNDAFVIFSCVDGTLESGFPVFKTEFTNIRGTANGWAGSPVGATAADLNGDGAKEAVFLPWDKGKIILAQAVKPDSFMWKMLPMDKYETSTDDGVFYVSVGVYDVDGDGKDELMGSLYNTTSGRVLLLNAPDGSIMDIDPMNDSHVARIREASGGAPFNNALGDLNGDGKAEHFFTNYARGQVNALAYNGAGDITNPANWITSEGFYDNSFVYKPKFEDFGDSTVFKKAMTEWNDNDISQIHGSFGIKIADDIDQDGIKELVFSALQSWWSGAWLFILEPTTTGVKLNQWRVITPDEYQLSLAYPNPFNASTTIEYTLPVDKQIKVQVYNTMGQVVRTLVNARMPAGTHRIVWDGMDNAGRAVASGMYLYTLEYGNFKQVQRMTLMK